MPTDNDESYLNLVTEKIESDKLLYDLSEKDRIIVQKLIDKKHSIHKSNKLFAEFRINRINKKISKIKNSKTN